MKQHFYVAARGGAVTVLAFLVAATPASASIVGDTVDVKDVAQFNTPTPTVIDLGQVVVGPKIEYPASSNNVLNIDFAGHSLTFSVRADTFISFATPFPPGPYFNGYVITDLTHPFTSASVNPATNANGFVASDLSFSGGTITLNMGGVSLYGVGFPPLAGGPSPSEVVLNLNLAVPEPASLALFSAGLMGLVGLLRLRKLPN